MVLLNFVDSSWDLIMTILKNPQMYSEDEDSKIERVVKLLKIIMRVMR